MELVCIKEHTYIAIPYPDKDGALTHIDMGLQASLDRMGQELSQLVCEERATKGRLTRDAAKFAGLTCRLHEVRELRLRIAQLEQDAFERYLFGDEGRGCPTQKAEDRKKK